MTDKWYLANRIDGQIEFYKNGQEKNENAYQRLQLWSFVAGAVVAAVSAIAAVYGAQFAAWTGALPGPRSVPTACRSGRSTSPRAMRR